MPHRAHGGQNTWRYTKTFQELVLYTSNVERIYPGIRRDANGIGQLLGLRRSARPKIFSPQRANRVVGVSLVRVRGCKTRDNNTAKATVPSTHAQTDL